MNKADATPDFPRPTTNARFPFSSIRLYFITETQSQREKE